MNEAREKLTTDFKTLIHDVQELLKATSSQTGENISDLRRRLGIKLEEGKKTLSEQEKIWRGKAQEARVSAEGYLREKPWAALGIAAGVGALLGLVLRRRNGNRSE